MTLVAWFANAWHIVYADPVWQVIVGVALTAFLAGIGFFLVRHIKRRDLINEVDKKAIAAARTKQAKADAWSQWLKKETTRVRKSNRWYVELDPDLETVWDLHNRGPGSARNIELAVRRNGTTEVSQTMTLSQLPLELPISIPMGGPERATHFSILLSWDDDFHEGNYFELPFTR